MENPENCAPKSEESILADAQRRQMELMPCNHPKRYEHTLLPGQVGCLLCELEKARGECVSAVKRLDLSVETPQLILDIFGVLTQECCSICEKPKFPQGMQAGDETKIGWSACVNERCAVYGEQKASACYRFSERASREQIASIDAFLNAYSERLQDRLRRESLQVISTETAEEAWARWQEQHGDTPVAFAAWFAYGWASKYSDLKKKIDRPLDPEVIAVQKRYFEALLVESNKRADSAERMRGENFAEILRARGIIKGLLSRVVRCTRCNEAIIYRTGEKNEILLNHACWVIQMYDFTYHTVLNSEWTTDYFDRIQRDGWELINVAVFSSGVGFYCFWRRPQGGPKQ